MKYQKMYKLASCLELRRIVNNLCIRLILIDILPIKKQNKKKPHLIKNKYLNDKRLKNQKSN